jgi:hypothetical protein
MKRRLILLIAVFVLAIASFAMPVLGQDSDGEEDALSAVDQAIGAALVDRIGSTFDESRAPIVDALAVAGDDSEALAEAYDDLAFWSLMYARGLESLGLPEPMQLLVDGVVSAHADVSLAAESLAADPGDASLLATYTDAEQARLASVRALYEALGLHAPDQDADSDADGGPDGASPSPAP